MIAAATLFLSAFLLFLIQPMLAKAILPAFGGSPSVWTVCLLFFQTLLVAGYAWAHVARRGLHIALLAVSVAALPIDPRPHDWAMPTLAILVTLAGAAGLPFVTLASTSPLVQRWSGLASPYRLYALSNLASFAALLAYPVLIEPYLGLSTQFRVWSVMYVVFVLVCALAVRRGPVTATRAASVRVNDFIVWIALSACSSGLLAATTNQMTQEIAPIPFLWILPMAIYLATLVAVFDRPALYDRRLFALLGSIVIPLTCGVSAAGPALGVRVHLLVDSVALMVCCFLLHGELALAKPPAAALTRFYLGIAMGGALGGAFVALVAPFVFSSWTEFPLLLSGAAALSLLQRYRSGEIASLSTLPPLAPASVMGLAFAVFVPVALFHTGSQEVIARTRNFYGILRVSETTQGPLAARTLTHGGTTHGTQFTSQSRRSLATSYYGPNSAVGMELGRSRGPSRIGLVGLGAGTLSAYGKPGDSFRYYEINAAVEDFARRYFTYLGDSRAETRIVTGDARLRLAAEAPSNFDLLVIDAFSSDAIPVHLLTLEAGRIYLRHLAPKGKLLIHISNRALNLEPVVRSLAHHLGLSTILIESPSEPESGAVAAVWMLLDRNGRPPADDPLLWRDDYAPLWRVLR